MSDGILIRFRNHAIDASEIYSADIEGRSVEWWDEMGNNYSITFASEAEASDALDELIAKVNAARAQTWARNAGIAPRLDPLVHAANGAVVDATLARIENPGNEGEPR